jgi:hypothetical protein
VEGLAERETDLPVAVPAQFEDGALGGEEFEGAGQALFGGAGVHHEVAVAEGTVLELSWYGDRQISLPLGEAFHSRRLVIRSSQVGSVSPARRSSRSYADRLALALDLLADPALDALVTGECAFEELPDVLPRLASGEIPALCHRVRYDGHA